MPRDERRVEIFRSIFGDCKLLDISYVGVLFTWEQGNLFETNIRERLDRDVANEDWMNLFLNYSLRHLALSMSNHCPLLLCIDEKTKRAKAKIFLFEAWWVMEKSLEGGVLRLWKNSSGSICDKLEALKDGLLIWEKFVKKREVSSSKILRKS